MASPFRIFRKYQKTLLVAAGVVLMFVFVIGDALVGYLGGSRAGGGERAHDAAAVAVRWDGGSLTNAELYDLTMRRRIVNAFIQQVEAAGRSGAVEAGVEPRQLRVGPILGPETPQQGVERSVVQTRLFADAARQAGMHVSDDTIVQYLDELGRGNVSRDDMRAMLQRISSGGLRVPIDYVLNALREEMLARNYVASHQFAFDTVTPQQRWEDWLSVNDRVVIEAAALPAESFLTEVKEPTDAELAKFFDEHKSREPQPDFLGQVELPSPTPGFAIPRKIDVQFIRADYEKFLAKLESEVSEDEIAKYYDQNKDLFIKADTGLIDDAVEKEGVEQEQTGESAAPAETPESTTNKTGDAEPGDETEEATDSDAATKPDEAIEPSTESESHAPSDANQESQPQPPESEEAAPPEGDQSSHDASLNKQVFRLAAFLQEAVTSGKAAPEAPAEEPTAEESSADGAGAVEPAESAAVEPSDGKSSDPATESSPADAPVAEEKPQEFQPLDEVRDLIRRELAERRAAEQLGKLMNELTNQLDAEFQSYLLSAEAEKRQPPPATSLLANAAPLAEKHGLEHGRTGPVSILELRDLPVGNSGSAKTGALLWQSLFVDPDLDLYQPISSVDVDGNRFVVMKTADTPGRVPKLADVKDDVVRAWKLQQAAGLASKRAEKLAKEAEQAGTPLTEFFADEKGINVVRTDPFSQFTGGDVSLFSRQQQPLRLSQPDGIVAAGPDFMRRVSELKVGAVAAIMNHDRSIAYVVREVEHQDSPDELRSAYLTEANSWPGLRLMTGGHAQIAARLLVEDITTAAGLKWERPADQIEQDDEEDQSDAG